MPIVENPTPEQMQKMAEEMRKKENDGLTPEEIEKRDREREMKKQKNVARIRGTMEIGQRGSYEKDGRTVDLGLRPEQMSAARVLLPEEVQNLPVEKPETAPCAFSCENRDALSLAREKCMDPSYAAEGGGHRILLLNLASAVRPGGGVRDGMGGQEEDLCRNSTLLLSLESDAAKSYYEYNNNLHTYMGSDAVVFSPNVAVFRDERGELLDDPFTISALTCSAPNVRFGLEGKTRAEYENLLYERIEGILRCAVHFGYPDIILGAFGCGAFQNDAALVSDDFYRALIGPAGCGLRHADFAVLCTAGKEHNYHEFCRNFSQNRGR